MNDQVTSFQIQNVITSIECIVHCNNGVSGVLEGKRNEGERWGDEINIKSEVESQTSKQTSQKGDRLIGAF